MGAAGAPVEVGVREALRLQVARSARGRAPRCRPSAARTRAACGRRRGRCRRRPCPRGRRPRRSPAAPSSAPRPGRARPHPRSVAARARARVASAIAACAHLAALPCSPPGSTSPAVADVAQKLFRRGGGRGLGEGAADVHAGVIVGAADAGASVGLDVDHRGHVQLRGARPVADLPDREELRQAAPVAPGQRRADVVERVRQRAGDLVLVKVCGAGLDVAGVCLQPLVVSGSDPVTEDVYRLGLAGESGRSAPRRRSSRDGPPARRQPSIVS